MTPRSAERDAYLLERQASARRTEHQVRERGRADADREPCHDARRQRHPERDAGQRAGEQHEPADPATAAGTRAERPPPRRPRRPRAASRDSAPAGPRRRSRAGRRRPAHPRTPTPPPRTGRSGRLRGARRSSIRVRLRATIGMAISTTAQTNSTSYAVSQNHPNRPGQRGEELLRRPVELPRSGRDERDQADHDQGERDEHDVGRPPCARRIARRGEDADVGVAERPEERTAGLRGTAVGVLGAPRGLGGGRRSIHRSTLSLPEARAARGNLEPRPMA